MKLKFETFFRGYVIVLIALLVWSVWRSAAQPASAPATNAPNRAAATATDASDATTAEAAAEQPPRKRVKTPQWIEDFAVKAPFLKWTLWDNELWKYLFSLIYIFLAFYISKLLDFLTRVWLRKWTERTETRFDDMLLELLNGPVKVVAFVIFLRIGLDVFDWPEVVDRFLPKGFTVIVAVSLTYMVLKFIDLLMRFWRERSEADADRAFDQQLFPIIRKSLKVFVLVVAVLVTLSNIGVDVTAAIASLSIGGLAVGLAAQDTLANLFGAVSVFVDKPFRIGDRIQLDNVDGVVESIGLRSTRVRNLDGHLITIPNKTMGNATITNITLRPNIRTLMNISVTYDTPAAKVQRAVDILNEIYKGHDMTQDVWISFNKFADASLNIFVIHWWKGTVFKDYLDGMQKLNLTIKERFDAEKIEFAFPTQTIYVKQGDEPGKSRDPLDPTRLAGATGANTIASGGQGV